jgi:IclR family transcriptional regulator, KDG regulon repressor
MSFVSSSPAGPNGILDVTRAPAGIEALTPAAPIAPAHPIGSQDSVTAVRSVERALTLLEALGSASSPSHLSDLARATGLAKATAHRMLNALVVRDFAARAGESYTLGSRLLNLAADARRADSLQRLFMPYLLELHERTRGVVSVGLLSGGHVLYSGSIHDYRGTPQPRQPIPAHCTALGKLLLAYQPSAACRLGMQKLERMTSKTVVTTANLRLQLMEIRRGGVAYAYEERILGEAEVAAPVFAYSRRVITGLSVAGPVTTFDVEQTAMHLTRIAHLASVYCRNKRIGWVAP